MNGAIVYYCDFRVGTGGVPGPKELSFCGALVCRIAALGIKKGFRDPNVGL
jgi:hypothetical protein